MTAAAIIGAGSSGLAAAHVLRDAGYTVTLFEKSHECGGRAATREREGFIYDHGAQYIKGSSPITNALISQQFRANDLITIYKPVWIFNEQGHIQQGDPVQNAEPMWNYRSGIRVLANRMAEGLDVRLGTCIGRIQQGATSWSLFDLGDRCVGVYDRLLITVPSGQASEIIDVSQITSDLRDLICSSLAKARYNPLISVILGYKPTPQVRPYYALVNTDKAHAISWLAWEHEKRVSAEAASTRAPEGAGLLIAQMAPQYSEDNWQQPDEEIIRDVAVRVARLINEPLYQPIFTNIQRWRYALPAEMADARSLRSLNAITMPMGMAFCGDAFVCGRVHLALEHGIEVATEFLTAKLFLS